MGDGKMRQRKLSVANRFFAGLFGALALFSLCGTLRAEEENVLFFDEEPAAEAAAADAPAVPAETKSEVTQSAEEAQPTEDSAKAGEAVTADSEDFFALETDEKDDAAESEKTETVVAETSAAETADGEEENAEPAEEAETVTAEKPQPKPEIDAALRQLAAGNARHTGQSTDAAKTISRPEADDESFPIASVFYASDISPDPDVLLDLPKKILYTVPIRAGVFTSEELDDLEYGIVNLQTPVAVVLTQYPSSDALYVLRNFDRLETIAKKDTAELGSDPNLSVQNNKPADNDLYLYSILGPSVARAKKAYPDMNEADLANVIAETAAWQSLETILMQSDAARRLISSGELSLIAAMLDSSTGQIYWLGNHPLQDEFLKAPPQQVVDEKQKEELAAVKASNAADGAPVLEVPAEEPPAVEELPAPLTEDVVTFYQDAWTPEVAGCAVVNEYYTVYRPYVPRWRVFYPSIWYYRPWYGSYLPYYTPYPYYDPWWYSGWGAYYPVRCYRYGCYIGCGVGFGFAFYVGSGFHPYDPWWDRPWCHRPIDHPRWHDRGPRGDIWYSGGPGWHAGGESWRRPRPHDRPDRHGRPGDAPRPPRRPDRPDRHDGPGHADRPDRPHHGPGDAGRPDRPHNRPGDAGRPDRPHNRPGDAGRPERPDQPEAGPRPSGDWKPGDVGRTIGEGNEAGEILSGETERGRPGGRRGERRFGRDPGNLNPDGPQTDSAAENGRPGRDSRRGEGRDGFRRRPGQNGPNEASPSPDSNSAENIVEQAGQDAARRHGARPADGESTSDRGARSVSGRGGRGNRANRPGRNGGDTPAEAASGAGSPAAENSGNARPNRGNTPEPGDTPAAGGIESRPGRPDRGGRGNRNSGIRPDRGGNPSIIGGGNAPSAGDSPAISGAPSRGNRNSGIRPDRGGNPSIIGDGNAPSAGDSPAVGGAPSRGNRSSGIRPDRSSGNSSIIGDGNTPSAGDSPAIGGAPSRGNRSSGIRPNRGGDTVAIPGLSGGAAGIENRSAVGTPAPRAGRDMPDIRPSRSSRAGPNAGNVTTVPPRAVTPDVSPNIRSRSMPAERPSRNASPAVRPGRAAPAERPSRNIAPSAVPRSIEVPRPNNSPAPARISSPGPSRDMGGPSRSMGNPGAGRSGPPSGMRGGGMPGGGPSGGPRGGAGPHGGGHGGGGRH